MHFLYFLLTYKQCITSCLNIKCDILILFIILHKIKTELNASSINEIVLKPYFLGNSVGFVFWLVSLDSQNSQ